MSDPVEGLVDRLLAADWSGSYEQRPSQAALMREYLRRSAWWAKRFDAEGWPFFDIASWVDPSVRADPGQVRRLQEGLPDWVYLTVRHTCVWALHFRALQESGADLPDLPDPFAPLLLMFERGSGFTVDGTGFIEVDFRSIRKGRRNDHLVKEPKAPLDPAELDAMDRR
ncbi:hypothetical protein [Actinorugispora endophytica]|uniref:Uncharacterized protein n=1 Tax=Actinorugispora endophytica TaxID=1605990 RepID=A0A4R6V1K1_9ACTN|nr:hypothetical protein [Actinorugispora endophytica]TDQ52272.1 hypothetical protein EV190_107104 [Actinorugispora endophytica]